MGRARSAASENHWKKTVTARVPFSSPTGTRVTFAFCLPSFSHMAITSSTVYAFGPDSVSTRPLHCSRRSAASVMRATSCVSRYAVRVVSFVPHTLCSSRMGTAYAEMSGCMNPVSRSTV